MTTPPTTIDQFALILGYPNTPLINYGAMLGKQNVAPDGSIVVPSNRLARCQALSALIDDIELKLTNARANSMARNLGTLTLDYSYHIAELVGEGSRKLEELSALLNLPIYFNRFTGDMPQDSSFYAFYGNHRPDSSPYSSYTPC